MTDIIVVINDLRPLAILLALLFGLLVGSFLNVVIARLPLIMKSEWYENIKAILDEAVTKGEVTGIHSVDDGSYKVSEETRSSRAKSYLFLAWPPSRCPTCQQKISSWDNIPLLSWFLLRGKCRGCQQPISAQYPLVEGVTGALLALLIGQMGLSCEALLFSLLLFGLIAATFIDLHETLLPDVILLPLLWLGLVGSYFNWLSLSFDAAFLGAIFGYSFFWVINFIFKLFLQKEGMGHGDFKLLALLGTWLGVNALLPIVLISTVVGSVIGVVLILTKRHNREKPIPFGPYLVVAGLIYLYVSPSFIHSYLPILWL